KVRGGIRRLAKRPVESGAILRRVRKNRHIGETAAVQLPADRADPAIHHVRGRDDVRAGARVGKRLLREDFERRIVGDFVIFADAALAVISVFAKTNVGDHQQIELGAANRFDRPLHHAVLCERAGPTRVFRLRQPEKNDPGNPQALHFPAVLDNAIGGLLEDSGHRGDFFLNRRAGTNEKRVDEAFRAEAHFANQIAQQFAFAEAARPLHWKTHRAGAPAVEALPFSRKASSATMTCSIEGSSASKSQRIFASLSRFSLVTGPMAPMPVESEIGASTPCWTSAANA